MSMIKSNRAKIRRQRGAFGTQSSQRTALSAAGSASGDITGRTLASKNL